MRWYERLDRWVAGRAPRALADAWERVWWDGSPLEWAIAVAFVLAAVLVFGGIV